MNEAPKTCATRLPLGGELPRDADPPMVSKFDTERTASSPSRFPATARGELTELADKIVKVQLERALGVGEVEIMADSRAP